MRKSAAIACCVNLAYRLYSASGFRRFGAGQDQISLLADVLE